MASPLEEIEINNLGYAVSDGSSKSSEDGHEHVEELCDLYGAFGKYQFVFTAWICYLSMFTAMTTLSITFMTPTLHFSCHDSRFNESENQCELTDNETVKCSNWKYSSSFYSPASTLTEKFNLVCEREWYTSLASSVQQGGDLTAGFFVSYLSDRFGRRPVCVLSLIPAAIGLTVFIFVKEVKWFIIAKFLYGFTGLAVNYLALVILIEMSGKKYRGCLSIISGTLGYTTGYVILPGIYWLIRNEQHYHIFIAAMFSMLAASFWIIPESPRWLLLKKRHDECFYLVKRIKRFNEGNIDIDDGYIKENLQKLSRKIQEDAMKTARIGSNPLDLFRGKEMAKRSSIIFYTSFVSGLIYLGVSLNANIFGGDMYWNFFLLGAIEIPCMFYCLIAERLFPRKILLLSSTALTGVVYLLTIAVPKGHYTLEVMMVVLGKFFVTAIGNLLLPYAPELYPTSIRSMGLGYASAFTSVGAMVSPFVAQLTKYSSLSVTFGIFGILGLTAAGLLWLLPETKNLPLPETLSDITKTTSKSRKSPGYSILNDKYDLFLSD